MKKSNVMAIAYMLSLFAIGGFSYYTNSETQQEVSNLKDHLNNSNKQVELLVKDKSKLEIQNKKLSDELKSSKVTINRQMSEIKILAQDLKKVKQRLKSLKTLASRGSDDGVGEIYKITAYTNGFESTGKTPSHKDYGLTASGVYTKEGKTIACPRELDFGTVVYIESVGVRVCEDRGN